MSTDVKYRQLTALPAMSSVLRRQSLRAVPELLRGSAIHGADPGIGLQLRGLTIDGQHVAQYCQVTGFRLRDEVPAPYLFVLAFPMILELMGDEEYPLPVLGSVHLSHDIEVHEPIRIGDSVDLTVRAGNIRPHRRGLVVDFWCEVYRDGALAVTQTASFLAKGARFDSSTAAAVRTRGEDDARTLAAPAQLAADYQARPTAAVTHTYDRALVGRYAEVSGDRNPIHVSALGAKAFGFARPIAHGMLTFARTVATQEGRLHPQQRLRVDFYRPIVLPAKVGLYEHSSAAEDNSTAAEDSTTIEVRSARQPERVHAVVRIDALTPGATPAQPED